MNETTSEITQESPQDDQINPEQNSKFLISFLNKLLEGAKGNHPTAQFKRFSQIYNGQAKGQTNPNLSGTQVYPNRNIVKPIIDTRLSLIQDIPFDILTEPKPLYFEDLANLKNTQNISEVLDSAMSQVEDQNNWELLKEDFLKTGEIYGPGIAELSWEQNGEVDGKLLINNVNPMDVFFDPSATQLENSNYVYIRYYYSPFTLKKKFPKFIEQIDKISRETMDSSNPSSGGQNENVVITYTNEFTSGMMYGQNNPSQSPNTHSIEVWKCYLLDDATYYPSQDDDVKQLKEKTEWAFRYPHGREIIFCKDVVFSDMAIPYDFGFPLQVYYPQANEDIYGHSLIFDLVRIQDDISASYEKIQILVDNYISCTVLDGTSKFGKDQSWQNMPIFKTDIGGLKDGMFPRNLTNNTLAEIPKLENYIGFLEQEAYKIARINEMMLSGATETNVNSGAMVQKLNDSPMSSIRSSQKRFREFCIGIGNKLVVMIQMHFNNGQLIQMATGDKYAYINPGAPEVGSDPQIEVYQKENLQKAIYTIKGDLNLGKYKVKVVTGQGVPRTKEAQSNLIMSTVNSPLMDKDPDMLQMVFDAIDMPYGNQIIELMKAKKQEAAQAPPPLAGLVDKLGMTFKDLPMYAQDQILEQFGINMPSTEIPQQMPVSQQEIDNQ